MQKLFKEVNYNLSTLIQQIEMGSIGLPDIQRPFIWADKKVRDLFDSMYRGYPVGYFLFWANANIDNSKFIGTGRKQLHSHLLIVDGQQRLTSLFAVIKSQEIIRENYSKTHIVIAFNPLEEKFEIPDATIRRNPRFFQNISLLWHQDINLFSVVNDFLANLKKSVTITETEEQKIQTALLRLKNLETYPFSVLELSSEISEEQVAEVFVRINSQGKTLNQADFILTLMSVFWEEGRVQIENFCRDCRNHSPSNASPFNYLIEPDPDQILRVSIGLAFRRARLQHVYNILRGKDLETGKFSTKKREEQFAVLKAAQEKALNLTTWHEFIKAIKQTGFIRHEFISSKLTLLYAYVFFLIGREDYKLDWYDLKKLIGRWFFMASITSRYSSSPETTMEMDLTKLRHVKNRTGFQEILDEIITAKLTPDFWKITLPMDLATSSPSSPPLFAYYASLKILDAKGLFSNLSIADLLQEGLKSKKAALERHHLFPVNWLKKSGYTDNKDINQIANYALLEWDDNLHISDSPPHVYLPKYLQRFSEAERRKMYYWHALPEGWEEMAYKDFLVKRRELISTVIKDAFAKISK